jgi:hypothetical protein
LQFRVGDVDAAADRVAALIERGYNCSTILRDAPSALLRMRLRDAAPD